MTAYGFEENYAKAWPEGAAPGKGIRRVQNCGKLNFVGEGTKEKRFEIEIPLHDGKALVDAEVWVSLSAKLFRKDDAAEGDAASGDGLMYSGVKARFWGIADAGAVPVEAKMIDDNQKAYTSNEIDVAYRSGACYLTEDSDVSKKFCSLNTTLPPFFLDNRSYAKKLIIDLMFMMPDFRLTTEEALGYRVEGELNYCVIGAVASWYKEDEA